jgi:hypothetical protein
MKPKSKLTAFLLNPSEKHLLTLEEYESLDPFDKGYACYLQADWKQSKIPKVNPYKKGTLECDTFQKGSFCAMQEVQEIEG